MAIQFRVRDGLDKGLLTRPYGGTWDRYASRFINRWDHNRRIWTPSTPSLVHVSDISEQAIPIVTDFYHRIVLACGGRRSGKSYGAAQKAITLALLFPGRRGMVLSPTYRQSKNVWNHIYKIMPRDWLLPGRHGLRYSDKEMRLTNGAVILFRSADIPDSARSDGVAWALFDERQDIGDEAAANAHLSISEGGDDYQIVETATIKAEFREHWDTIQANPLGRVIRMRSEGNPFISHAMFREARTFLDARMAKQELDAEWPEAVGLVYYPFKDDFIADFPLRFRDDSTTIEMHSRFDTPSDGEYAAKYYISIDPPAHAVIWKIYRDGTMHAIDEIAIGSDGSDGDVRDLSERCYKLFSPAVVVVDPHETGYSSDIKKYFKRFNVFRFTSMPRTSIEYRLTAVRARMEAGKFFVSPKCKFLIEALKEHKYDENTNKPDKKQKSRINDRFTVDHIADACGYGVYKLFPAKYAYEQHEERIAA